MTFYQGMTKERMFKVLEDLYNLVQEQQQTIEELSKEIDTINNPPPSYNDRVPKHLQVQDE